MCLLSEIPVKVTKLLRHRNILLHEDRDRKPKKLMVSHHDEIQILIVESSLMSDKYFLWSFSRALVGYSISEYPALFTDSPPVRPSERRQTGVSCEQNAFAVCCRNKQRNFKTNQASCSRNKRRR